MLQTKKPIKSCGTVYGCWNVAKRIFMWYQDIFLFKQNKFIFDKVNFYDIKIYFNSIKTKLHYKKKHAFIL